jgi:hypothetical protein
MAQDITVRVASQPSLIRDLDPAEDQLAIRCETVEVEPEADLDHRRILTLPSGGGQPGVAGRTRRCRL